MKASRRRFLRLIAAGSAMAVTNPALAVTGTKRTTRKAGGAKPVGGAKAAAKGAAPALAEEIRKQKASVEQALKALRDCPLPGGSEPGFTFVPVRAHRKESTP